MRKFSNWKWLKENFLLNLKYIWLSVRIKVLILVYFFLIEKWKINFVYASLYIFFFVYKIRNQIIFLLETTKDYSGKNNRNHFFVKMYMVLTSKGCNYHINMSGFCFYQKISYIFLLHKKTQKVKQKSRFMKFFFSKVNKPKQFNFKINRISIKSHFLCFFHEPYTYEKLWLSRICKMTKNYPLSLTKKMSKGTHTHHSLHLLDLIWIWNLKMQY